MFCNVFDLAIMELVNGRLSILTKTSLVIPKSFLSDLSTICNDIIIGSNLKSLIFSAIDNGITFTLPHKSMSAYPTFISSLMIGNLISPGSHSF